MATGSSTSTRRGEHTRLLDKSTAQAAATSAEDITDIMSHTPQEVIIIGDASIPQTVVNMAKTCMGTGCLVLPFAARQGGLLLHTFGLVAIAGWNVYTVQRLCLCLDYLPSLSLSKEGEDDEEEDIRIGINSVHTDNDGYESLSRSTRPNKNATTAHHQYSRHPPEGTAMFGKVVWYAMGPSGLIALDVLMLSFLIGILVTYINAMRSFLRDTPLTTHMDVVDALLLVAIMGPLSCVPHMGYLAKASAMGLLVLAGTFVVLGVYGVEEYQHRHHQQQQHSPPPPAASIATSVISLMLPQDGLWGISHWFGCVVFSFGVAPLTYNFRSSMADPNKMVPATSWALMGVAMAYMGLGIGFWVLFPHLEGDLLQEMPLTGVLPSLTRLAMVVVVLTTAPLLIVPCGELIESKIPHTATRSILTSSQYQHDDEDHHRVRRIIFRFGICFLGVGISLYVPGFVDVLSFVGCCCVACLGFCIPPFLHGLLCFQARRYRPWNKMTMAVDVLMLSWGIFATVVSTTYTFRQISAGTTS